MTLFDTFPDELLYAIPTLFLTPLLLAVLIFVIWLGARLGARRSPDAAEKAQVSALQSSLMGLLALLVGFSFSLALGRFDERSVALVDEANAIGTAWLRTDLLAGEPRDTLRAALADYAESRLRASALTLNEAGERDAAHQRAATAFQTAWTIAAEAARTQPNPATVAVVSALNDMADAYTSLDAALHRHVPEVVLFLLLATLLSLGWIMGLTSGQNGRLPQMPLLLLMLLIVLLFSVILDLDRPKRGLIRIDVAPLTTATEQILIEAGRLPASKVSK